MFEKLTIGTSESFRQNLNKYDVIHLDVQWCMMDAGAPEATVDYMNEHVIAELQREYPQVGLDHVKTAYGALSAINTATGNKFVVIIDEWDVLIRDEAMNQAVQDSYINFLRGMFKGSEPGKDRGRFSVLLKYTCNLSICLLEYIKSTIFLLSFTMSIFLSAFLEILIH